jgi:hypothetical protein
MVGAICGRYRLRGRLEGGTFDVFNGSTSVRVVDLLKERCGSRMPSAAVEELDIPFATDGVMVSDELRLCCDRMLGLRVVPSDILALSWLVEADSTNSWLKKGPHRLERR